MLLKVVNMIKEIGLPLLMIILQKEKVLPTIYLLSYCRAVITFFADGRIISQDKHHSFGTVYRDCGDLSVEQKVEAVLDKHGIFYDKLENLD